VTFAGNVTRDKAVRLLEIVELLGGIPNTNQVESNDTAELSKIDKILLTIEKHFQIVWFSSKNVQTIYEREMKEPISLSTVSTYLARLVERGTLLKNNNSNNLRYRVVTEVTRHALNFTKK
jgi:Fe2+ or Zn2+ uptake regulation protein